MLKVACVGNSITYGIGVSDPDKESYPARLQQMLGEGYTVERFGKPGATLLNKGHRPFMQQKEFKDALAFAGDVVVIQTVNMVSQRVMVVRLISKTIRISHGQPTTF